MSSDANPTKTNVTVRRKGADIGNGNLVVETAGGAPRIWTPSGLIEFARNILRKQRRYVRSKIMENAASYRRGLEKYAWFVLSIGPMKSMYAILLAIECYQKGLREDRFVFRDFIRQIETNPFQNDEWRTITLLRSYTHLRRDVKALRLVEKVLCERKDHIELNPSLMSAAMNAVSASGSIDARYRIGAFWMKKDAWSATQNGNLRETLATWPAYRSLAESFYDGKFAPRNGFFPELALPSVCRNYQPRNDFVPGRILQVTSSLGPGGAERQFVGTVSALASYSRVDPTRMPLPVAGVLSAQEPADEFFLGELLSAGTTVSIASELDATDVRTHLSGTRPILEPALELLDLFPASQRGVVLKHLFLLERYKPEVVQYWQDETNVLGGIAALIAGIPRIALFTRSMRPSKITRRRRYLRSGYRELLKMPQVVLLNNSLEGARDYAQWLSLPLSSVHTIYNGLDIDTFCSHNTSEARTRIRLQLGIPQDAIVVGGVMRMSSEKCPHLWVDVCFNVAATEPLAHFICAGDGPLFEEVKARVAASPYGNRFHLPGSVSPVAPWLGTMNVLLGTSSTEGLPNVPIEAQAVGTPVVVTNAGGSKETLIEGVTGLVCPIGDLQSLSEACLKAIRNADWRERACKEAAEHCRRTFSIDTMRSGLLALYQNTSNVSATGCAASDEPEKRKSSSQQRH